VIVTGFGGEALHLEAEPREAHRPPFNVRLRDDKSFPYIAVTVEDEYPRVMFTRERHRPRRLVLRPVREREESPENPRRPQPLFPYRPVRRPEAGTSSGIPCLDYHIDRCWPPCVGYVTKEDYGAIIDRVIESSPATCGRSSASSRRR